MNRHKYRVAVIISIILVVCTFPALSTPSVEDHTLCKEIKSHNPVYETDYFDIGDKVFSWVEFGEVEWDECKTVVFKLFHPVLKYPKEICSVPIENTESTESWSGYRVWCSFDTSKLLKSYEYRGFIDDLKKGALSSLFEDRFTIKVYFRKYSKDHLLVKESFNLDRAAGNSAPRSRFSFSEKGSKFSFSFNEKAYDPDGKIVLFQWDFGDGESSSSPDPDHTYNEPGIYWVELAVMDNRGSIDTKKQKIEVGKQTGELTIDVVDESNNSLNAKVFLDGSSQGWSWGGSYTVSDLSPGSYEIRVEKENYETGTESVYLSSGETEEITVTLKEKNESPEASYTYSPENPQANQSIEFMSDSTDPDGYVTDYSWTFGDGDSATVQRPTHAYSQQGSYEVKLTVVDNDGTTDSITRKITVGRAEANLIVSVVDESDESLDAELYLDGSYQADTGWNGTYTFDGLSPGNYRVEAKKDGYLDEGATLTLTSGEREEITLSLGKEDKQPTASYTYKPTKPQVGQLVQFTSDSSDPDGEITDYNWIFDDGDTSPKKNPSHKYTSPGTYQVKLIVTDNEGADSSTVQEITVSEEQEQEPEIDEKFGLVVGITDYQYESLNNLSFPTKDAKAFYNLLLEGGFSKENVTLLTDKEAITNQFDAALSQLVTETSKDDLVVIYYSGHGAQGKDYDGDEKDGRDEYYVTYDTDPSNGKSLYSTALRDDIFANRVKSIPSDRVAIFIDSCYSAGATKSVKGFTLPGQKSVPNNNLFSDFRDLDGTALFASSQENQSSFEPQGPEFEEKMNHGVFTYYLLEGLKGEADSDNDGSITIEELKGYVVPNVEKFTSEYLASTQVPVVKGGIKGPVWKEIGKLEGKVKTVLGEGKEVGEGGGYVTINLGKEDGVKPGDQFKVFLSTKAIEVVVKKYGKLVVSEVVGPHLSVAKILETDFYIENGFRVRRIKPNSNE